MPIYKTEKNGTWYAMVRYKDWKGERKQKCQRGFATKREAQEWERQFQLQKQANMDMTANVKHFFTLLGKMFFTSYGKEFFTYLGKQIFTS